MKDVFVLLTAKNFMYDNCHQVVIIA